MALDIELLFLSREEGLVLPAVLRGCVILVILIDATGAVGTGCGTRPNDAAVVDDKMNDKMERANIERLGCSRSVIGGRGDVCRGQFMKFEWLSMLLLIGFAS